MNGTTIIAEVIISFMCVTAAFGVFGILWLIGSEVKDRWKRHQSRLGAVRRGGRL